MQLNWIAPVLAMFIVQALGADCMYIAQSANGEYFACRELHDGKITVVDRDGREVSQFPELSATAFYVADDGKSLLGVNLYRRSAVYLTLASARTNFTLLTERLAGILRTGPDSLFPLTRADQRPLVRLGVEGATNAALLYLRAQNKIITITSDCRIYCEDFEISPFATEFLGAALRLLGSPAATQRLNLYFRMAGASPPPFWRIADAWSFVQNHKGQPTVSKALQELESSMVIAANWQSLTERDSLKVTFPVARNFPGVKGKSVLGDVRINGTSGQIYIRIFSGNQKEIGCVALHSMPDGGIFSIKCDWMPEDVEQLRVEKHTPNTSTSVVIGLDKRKNLFDVTL